jgi:uncharacterized protein YcbX
VRVSQIWSYPVKSMVGEMVDAAEVSSLGIVGDRHWAIRDHELGGIRGAKKIGDLMKFTARRRGRDVVITLPDGSSVSSSDPEASSVLSVALGRRVDLESLAPIDDLDHYRRGPSDNPDMLDELRRVFGRDADEPLPDFAAFPPEVMEFESPPGTHHDCWPLMVMTESALNALRTALPDSVVDIRRFRPSFVVDGAPAGHPEFRWSGRRATIGTCEVEFLSPCPRCVMVTREISSEIPEDRRILRHVVRDLNQNVGVYARVITPGMMSVGDEIVFGADQ